MTVARSMMFGFVSLVVVGIYPQEVLADEYTNKKFLTLTNEQQKFWLIGSINALFHVAAAKSQQQGQCVFDWYYSDTPKQNGIILGSMEKYPESTPSAVLLALTERKCGAYRK